MKTSNSKIAQKIVDQLAELRPGGEGFAVSIPQLGYESYVVGTKDIEVDGETRSVPAKTTLKEAKSILVKRLTSELDDETITLSDTWAEDNLE